MTAAPVYLDHQASTPLDHRVKSAMERCDKLYGNPHTTSHLSGIEAGRAVEVARRQVAKCIGGNPRRIVFTSGATEANNLAIFGVARTVVGRRRILVLASEHSSVIEPTLALREEGFEVVLLPVGSDGIVDLPAVERSVDGRTALVSAMHVNNETGVVQPIAEIAEICHRQGALVHSDCAQSIGRMRVDVQDLGADLLTFSAHKCYGPKGIGALYVGGSRKITLKPLFFGGGQEGGLRPGTLPVPLCVGFGEACRISSEEVDGDRERMESLADELLQTILTACPEAKLNGSSANRAPGAFNICFPGAAADELLSAFDGIHVSSGSACASAAIEPSRVLLAYGLTIAEADSSLRFCVGRFTGAADIELAKRVVMKGIRQLGLAKMMAA